MNREEKEGEILKRFQIALSFVKLNGKPSEDGLIKEASVLLESVKGLAVRKVLSDYLHRTGHGRHDWLGLATSIDFSHSEHLVKVAQRWLEEFIEGNNQIGSSTDEYIFYSSFILKLAKDRENVRNFLGEEDFYHLRRKLIFVVVALSELRDENTSSLLKAVVKLNEIKGDLEDTKNNLLQMANDAYENSIFIPGNLLLLSMIAGELKSSPLEFLKDYLHAIPIWAADQELASAASQLIVELLKWYLDEATDQLSQLLLSKKRAIVETVLRVWLSRATNSQFGREGFIVLLQKMETMCREHFSKLTGRYWPPNLENIEDFTCIDPQWEWEESTGVSWKEDRLIDVFVKLWLLFYQKINLQDRPKLSIDNEFLQAGIFYHDAEIRQRARKLATLVEGGQAYLEAIPNKPKYIDPKEEEEQREKVFLPKDVKIDLLPVDFDELCKVVEENVTLCGSSKIGEVPSLPTTQANLTKKYSKTEESNDSFTGDRIVSKILCEAMEAVKDRKDIAKQKKIDFIHNIILRTRLKAVVNNGCDLMEEILRQNNSKENYYQSVFKTHINYLLSTENNIRTLVFSRVLWTCCVNQPNLFEIFFKDHIKVTLKLDSPPPILARILKVVKHFVSQKNCLCSIKSDLLSFCLEAQTHDDFLVRSAANIVFGFLLKSMTKPRKCPLFVLIGSEKELWNSWRKEKLCKISELPKTQRILLLSLLKQYIIVHEEFYSQHEWDTIILTLEQVEILRQTTGDIRERRFCIDVLMQLTPTDDHKTLLENFTRLNESSNHKEDKKYLVFRLLQLNAPNAAEIITENILELTGCSQFIKEISDLVQDKKETFEETINSIRDRQEGYDNELKANLTAIKLEILAWKWKGNKLPWRELLNKWINHPFPRVRSLMSRIPIALGEEKFFKSLETFNFC